METLHGSTRGQWLKVSVPRRWSSMVTTTFITLTTEALYVSPPTVPVGPFLQLTLSLTHTQMASGHSNMDTEH
jgi:hypothetical protein